MNRSAYCIEMLKLLAARGFMRKEELAKGLDVNPRNIIEYRKELEAAGIPHLYLEIDQQLDSFEQIRTRVQSFAEMLI